MKPLYIYGVDSNGLVLDMLCKKILDEKQPRVSVNIIFALNDKRVNAKRKLEWNYKKKKNYIMLENDTVKHKSFIFCVSLFFFFFGEGVLWPRI